MITIDITPAKRRFGLPKARKQWQFQISNNNGELIDPRDTYANVGDIRAIFDQLTASHVAVRLRIHYATGVVEDWLR